MRPRLRRIFPRSQPVAPPNVGRLERRLEDLLVLQARLLSRQLAGRPLSTLHEAEFKAFSQFGDDGIIEYLVATIGIPEASRRFVEIGVEDYEEANTRLLLVNRNWHGLVVESSARHVERIRAWRDFWRYDLEAVTAFVDRENVNALLARHGFDRDLGLISIDIDGNDYWVWESVEVRPLIVVIEYNSIFGPERAVTIPYDARFERTRAHASNLYWGASLKAVALLGERKGYRLVGSNSAGNNAYFVRNDVTATLPSPTVADAYVESRYRESRGAGGELTFLRGAERLRAISELPLWDVEREMEVHAGDLLR